MKNRGKIPKDRPDPPKGPPNVRVRMGQAPPGPHWFQRADRKVTTGQNSPPHSVDKDASDVISVEVPVDLVILVLSEGLKATIERFHQAHDQE